MFYKLCLCGGNWHEVTVSSHERKPLHMNDEPESCKADPSLDTFTTWRTSSSKGKIGGSSLPTSYSFLCFYVTINCPEDYRRRCRKYIFCKIFTMLMFICIDVTCMLLHSEISLVNYPSVV